VICAKAFRSLTADQLSASPSGCLHKEIDTAVIAGWCNFRNYLYSAMTTNNKTTITKATMVEGGTPLGWFPRAGKHVQLID
jgi:hypothetical protein